MAIDDGNAESYNFWGTWLRMTDLCNVYRSRKLVAQPLKATEIFKTRARNGLLRFKSSTPTKRSAIPSLPVEIWGLVQEQLRVMGAQQFHSHGEEEDCTLGKPGDLDLDEFGNDRAQGSQAWCFKCFGEGWDTRPNVQSIPENTLRGFGYPPALQAQAEGKECKCKACEEYTNIHELREPFEECPTHSALDFETEVLKPYGLRLACVLTVPDEDIRELCGVTLRRFPDFGEGKGADSTASTSHSSSRAGQDIDKGQHSRKQSAKAKVSESKVTGKRKRGSSKGDTPAPAISDAMMKDLLKPFNQLLDDYPSLRVLKKGADGALKESPFLLCRHHTPVKRGPLGPEGWVAKYDGGWDEEWPSDLQEEVGSDFFDW